MIEQEDITLLYRTIVLVQLDVEFQQFTRAAKGLYAEIVDSEIDFRVFRSSGHLLTTCIGLHDGAYMLLA